MSPFLLPGNQAALGSYCERASCQRALSHSKAIEMNVICFLLMMQTEVRTHRSSRQRMWLNFGFRHSVIWSTVIFKAKQHCAQNTNSLLSRPTDAVFDRAVRNILLTFDLYKYSLWHFNLFYSLLFHRDCSDPPPPPPHVSVCSCDRRLSNFLHQKESLPTHTDHSSVFFSISPKFPNRL